MISPVTNKVPYAGSIVSSCKGSGWDYSNLVYDYNFVLILNEYVYSVKSIGGIDRDYLNNPEREGGNEWPVFIRDYNNSSFIKINIERAMPIRRSQIVSSTIRAGVAAAAKMCEGVAQNIVRRSALLSAAALDPIATLENGPAIGIIQVFNKTFTKDVANFKFFSYGAERWSATQLDARSGDIVIESIDLLCTDLIRMTSDWSKGPSGIWNKDSDGSMYDEKEMENLEKFRNVVQAKQQKIKELYKTEDSFTDKQIENLEKEYDKLINEIEDPTGEKRKKYEKIKSDLLDEEKEKNKDEIYNDAKNEEIVKEKEQEEEEKREKEEEQNMKKRAAEEVKKEVDRLKRLKEWKDNQKT